MSKAMWMRSGALAVLAMAAACAPRTPPPEPAPPPPPAPAPAPTPSPPPPAPAAWQDAPLTPGDWTYRAEGRASAATYISGGAALFALRCEASRQLSLARPGGGAGALVVRTTYGDRALTAQLVSGNPQPALVASLAPSDPLLDRIVFSRGRFAVDAPGTARLILPAWAEAARVVEDCRG